MKEQRIKIGHVEEHWNASFTRILKYSVEMYDEGLKEHKIVSAPELDILENKIDLQVQKWNEKWEKIVAKQRAEAEKISSIEEADKRTEEAQEAVRTIDQLLLHTLSVDDTVNWEVLKRYDEFPEKCPDKPNPKIKREYPQKPIKEEPSFTLLDKLIKSRKEKKIKETEERYLDAVARWEEIKSEIDQYNLNLEKEYEEEIEQWKKDVQEWENRKKEFEQEQAAYNKKIDHLIRMLQLLLNTVRWY
jgi:restriction system protein